MKIKNKGFTLIEIIVVMAVLAILLPTVFSVIYIIMQQQLRVHKLTETKRQGDAIMAYMKETIARDAWGVSDEVGGVECNTAGSTYHDFANFFFFVGNNTPPDIFTFRLYPSGNISYEHYFYHGGFGMYVNDLSANLNATDVVSVSGFDIECRKRDNNSYPVIAFSYDVTFVDTTPTAQEGVVTLHYQTKVKLRRTLD